jgi:outer membrane protein assembly factor BamB
MTTHGRRGAGGWGAWAALLLGLAALLAGTAARGGDWSQFGHDVRHTNATDDRVKLPLTELWSWQGVANGTSLYGAAISRGRIYYITHDGVSVDKFGRAHAARRLVCANSKTGEMIWSQSLMALQLVTPLSDAVAPAVDGGVVYAYDQKYSRYMTRFTAVHGSGGADIHGILGYDELAATLATLDAQDAPLARVARNLLNVLAAWIEADGNLTPEIMELARTIPGFNIASLAKDTPAESDTFTASFTPPDGGKTSNSGNGGPMLVKIEANVGATEVLRVFDADRGLPGDWVFLNKPRFKPVPLLTLHHAPLPNGLTESAGGRATTLQDASDWLGPPLVSNGTLRAASVSDFFVTWTPNPDPRKDGYFPLQMQHPIVDLNPNDLFPTRFSGFPIVQGPTGIMLGTDAYNRFLGMIEPQSTQRTWHLDVRHNIGAPSSSGGRVFIPLGGSGAHGGITAINGGNGETLWTYAPDGLSPDPPNAPRGALEKKLRASHWSNPGLALMGGCVYGEVNGTVVALEEGSGEPKWRHELPPHFGVRSLAATKDLLFLCVSACGNIREPLWAQTNTGLTLLIALNLKDGKLEWGQRVPRAGGLAAADGLLYFMDGGMHIYGPAERTFRLAANSENRDDYLVTVPAREKDPIHPDAGDPEPALDESHLAAAPGADPDPAEKPAPADAAKMPEKGARAVADATFLRLRYDEPRPQQFARLRQRREALPGVPLILCLDALDATRAHWSGAGPASAQWRAEYVAACAELAAAARPEHFEVLPEINVYLVQNPERFADVRALAAELVPAVHAAAPGTQVVFSFNAEVLSGRYSRGDYRPFEKLPQPLKADVAIAVELAGLADEVGLTTYPQAAFVQAREFTELYLPSFHKLFGEKPLLLTRVAVRAVEKVAVGELEQTRFLKKVVQSSYWLGLAAMCYPELITEEKGPGASPAALRLGGVGRPALAVWQDVLHWQLRGKLTVSLIEQPVQEEKPLGE